MVPFSGQAGSLTMSDVREIHCRDRLLALLIPADFHAPGLTFPTSPTEAIQVGCWNYDSGRDLAMHWHVPNPRIAPKTQEAVYVKRGSVRVFLALEDGQPVEVLDLGPGDTLVVLDGAHRYLILEDDTRILEFKNGPFVGVEADKKLVDRGQTP